MQKLALPRSVALGALGWVWPLLCFSPRPLALGCGSSTPWKFRNCIQKLYCTLFNEQNIHKTVYKNQSPTCQLGFGNLGQNFRHVDCSRTR